ncbi:MAG: ABC transporter permease, partial [Oscillospiraceae bacterium]|nr:ABC transporter permease [Oscillospiraceae bacterium]
AIGTYKALGYSSSQIAGKYVRYAAIAGIIGSIIGSIVCILILPKTIFSAYSQLYYLPSLKISTPWLMIIIAFVVALACTVLVAYLSCRKSLREVPAQLMRPKSPKSGKKILLERIPGLWKLFSFSSKITARNLFRYKIRLTMTIVGIAGCAALVVAAFGLQDAISPIVDKQFGEISDYDLMLTVNPMNAEDSVDFLAAVEADTDFEAYSFDRYSSVGVENIEGTEGLPEVYLVVPESPENLSDIVTFKEAGTGKIVSMDDSGVILTEKAANIIGAQKGSTINLIYNNKQYPVTVSAVMENYCEHYVYMTPALYETTFGKELYCNILSTRLANGATAAGAMERWLSSDFGILTITDIGETSSVFRETISSLNMIIIIMLVAAGALAFIVVYNLTNINISERVREIATLKVLGYKHSETNMYIFKENIIMGIIGIIFGGVIGYFLANYMVKTVEVDVVMFYRHIDWTSFLYAAILTLGFILLVNLVMTRKLRKISMVESLKAIE